MRHKSNNYTVLKEIMSKSRRFKIPPNMDYIILYTFLYKYCSDTVRDFLDFELKGEELTIDEAYKSKTLQSQFRFDSLKLNGFYIKRPEVFIEEVVNDNYLKSGFLPDFLKVFPEYTVFSPEYHNMEYFDILFKTMDNEIDTFMFDEEVTRGICEIIQLISKLNIFDEEFDFTDVFNIVSASRLMHSDSNPEYITQILIELVLSEKNSINKFYDPFMKDGSSIMGLYSQIGYGLEYCYGKDENKLNFLHTAVKLFLNNFSLNSVFLKNEDALDSIDIDGASFDVIASRIPIAIKNYYSSNMQQNIEMVKRSKRSEIETLLVDKLNMDGDSFKQDLELNKALENLVEKIDLQNDSNLDLSGRYEPLKDSEFLFLINLIDSLKEDGIMVISISENFLFKESLEILREYLTLNKNYIDTIIRIPNEISRSRPEVVIVFKKNRNFSDVLFIDMTSDYDTKRGGLMFPGLFRGNLLLDNETIDKMKCTFVNKSIVPKFSNMVSLKELEKNNYNLSVSRYVDTFEGEFIYLDDLISEKEEIDSNLNDLNLKIEKMMDELNIRL